MATENSTNLLSEMRRERKILMALQDRVDEYIKIDLTHVDINKPEEYKKLDLIT